MLGRIAKKIVGMAHDKLIERRRGGYQHGARASAAASGAPGALPRGGNRARVTGHDDGIERAHVNAKLERARGNHATNFSVPEAAFDLAPLVWQVAAAVAANVSRFSRRLWIGLLQISEKDFRVQAGIREDHGLQIAIQEFLRHARGFIDVTASDAQSAIDDGRIVEDEGFLRRGRAVGVQDFDLRFQKPSSQISGIGNRGGAANELRVATVEARDAAETPKDVAQVAAKDAAIGVQLIDDDIAQVFE